MTRPCWFLGSDRNFAGEQSAAPAGRAEGAGNLGSEPENARSRTSTTNQTSTHFAVFRCRSVAAAGDLLFFVSPKKPREKNGDPGVCVPPLRCGQPAVLAPAGVDLELASLRQSLALIRLDLRSSAHTQGFSKTGSESDAGSGSCTTDATNFIAARAIITWARGLKHVINHCAAGFWGSDHNFAAQHPKARRIWALTSTTPDPESASGLNPAPESVPHSPCGRAEQGFFGSESKFAEPQARPEGAVLRTAAKLASDPNNPPDFGSPFFSPGFFGEAKKCRSPAAATERHRTYWTTRCSIQGKASTGSARTDWRKHGFQASTSSGRAWLIPNGLTRPSKEVKE